MRLRLALIGCLLGVCVGNVSAQQIPQYSQYLLNGLLVNPAYTGYRNQWYAQLFYHNQWMQAGTPQYIAFAADGKVANGVNLGLIYSSELMGAIAINTVSASYAYRMMTSKTSDLSFGLALGMIHYGMNYSRLNPIEENDPVLQSLTNKWVPGVDVGMYYGSDKFYAGLSFRNIANGKELATYETGDFLIPLSTWHSVLTMGLSLPVSKKVEFRPSMMWQEDFKTPSHIDVTAALLFMDRFWVGVSFRTDQTFWKTESLGDINELYSMAIIAELFLTDYVTLSYAYGIGLNTYSAHYFGGHEVSVGYYFSRKTDSRFNRKYRYKKYTTEDICWYCL